MQKYRLHLMIAVCLALAAVVWFDNQSHDNSSNLDVARQLQRKEAIAENTSSQTTVDNTPPARLQIGNPLAAIAKDQLKEITERPLFAPSRRRPLEKQAATRAEDVAAAPRQNYELLGVLRNGDRAIALLRRASDGTSFRVETGDTIGGWRVAKVETASVLLERGSGASIAVTLNP